jgi:hypothetical protein
MKKNKALSLAIILLFSNNIFSQNTLQGVVRDGSSTMPLLGVTIYIPDLKTGAYSDSMGNYSIKNIPAGSWLVETSFIGYGKIFEAIVVKGITHKNFSLFPLQRASMMLPLPAFYPLPKGKKTLCLLVSWAIRICLKILLPTLLMR